MKQAEGEEQGAKEPATKGHGISARDQFFEACNSYRASEYYTNCRIPEHWRLRLKTWTCFQEAMQYIGHTFEVPKMPYKTIELPVYVMSPDTEALRRKTLINLNGLHGTPQEEYSLEGRRHWRGVILRALIPTARSAIPPLPGP